VPNPDDEHGELALAHFINHTVGTDADAPQASLLTFEKGSKERLFAKRVDGGDDPLTIGSRERFKVSSGA
jgi:hypothetical protein